MNNYHLSNRERALANMLERRGVTGYRITYNTGSLGLGWMIWIGDTPQLLGSNTKEASASVRSGSWDFLKKAAKKTDKYRQTHSGVR